MSRVFSLCFIRQINFLAGLSAEHISTYYTCWYNQETKLLLTKEGGSLPPCNISVNEWTKTVRVEVENPGEVFLINKTKLITKQTF